MLAAKLIKEFNFSSIVRSHGHCMKPFTFVEPEIALRPDLLNSLVRGIQSMFSDCPKETDSRLDVKSKRNFQVASGL